MKKAGVVRKTFARFLTEAFIRKALTWLGGALITYGVLTPDEGEGLVSRYLEEIVGLAFTAGSSAWTVIYQKHVRAKVEKALEMRAGTSPTELERALKEEVK